MRVITLMRGKEQNLHERHIEKEEQPCDESLAGAGKLQPDDEVLPLACSDVPTGPKCRRRRKV